MLWVSEMSKQPQEYFTHLKCFAFKMVSLIQELLNVLASDVGDKPVKY